MQEAERQAAANAPKYVPGKGLVSAKDADAEGVGARPTGFLANPAEWDRKYGKTHNPDGTH